MLIEYSSYFVAYLLFNLEKRYRENINNIILFGSVARGEAEKESDIDIFIDIKKKTRKIEKEIKRLEEKFYSSREASLFKLKGVNNKFSIIIGKLENWKELKTSIESTGILLYGKYIPSGIKGRKHVVIFWDKIERNRGAFLNKIYGFKVKGKAYSGLIEKFNGIKLGKSSLMVPLEHREEITKLLKKYKVSAKIIEVWH